LELDLDASLQGLAEWLAESRKSEWKPTPDAKELRGLARDLDRTVEHLQAAADALQVRLQWTELQDLVDEQSPGRFEYAGTAAADTAERLREIAEKARTLADALPNPRAKLALADAADVFLHLWYEAGRDRPTLTGTEGAHPSEAVLAFRGVLETARVCRSLDNTRKLLAKALGRFDPHCGTGWLRFAVWR
jgi:hypothetical protein